MSGLHLRLAGVHLALCSSEHLGMGGTLRNVAAPPAIGSDSRGGSGNAAMGVQAGWLRVCTR